MRSVLFALLLAGVSMSAVAETMQCTQYGFTANEEDFHQIKLSPRVTVFNIEENKVTVGGEVYTLADPSQVGLEGLAITYFQQNNEKVLYLYVNEQGKREIGISLLRADTDDMFADKSVYTGCEVKTTGHEEVVVTKTSLRRLVDPTQPLFTF